MLYVSLHSTIFDPPLDLSVISLRSSISMFSGLNKLKDALDGVIHDDQKGTPARYSKTHEVRRNPQGRKQGT